MAYVSVYVKLPVLDHILQKPLMSVYVFSQVCGGMHVEGAIEQVQALQTELDDIRRSAVNGSLVPLPGETVSIF